MDKSNSDQKDKENKQLQRLEEAKIVRKIVVSLVSLLILVTIGGSIGTYVYIKSGLEPVDRNSKEVIEITIPIGSSSAVIGNILEEHNIIRSGKLFRYYVKFRNESGFQAGNYNLSPSMEIQEIVDQLKTGKVIKEPLFTITIPEGKQLEEIATIIENKTEHTREDILKKANDRDYLNELIELYPTILSDDILNSSIRYPLEGYLYPSTYDFYEESPGIESILEKMIGQTELILSPYLEQISKGNLSVHELLTFASLIEEEATMESDRRKISSVFHNRLEANMPLQTDPTVLYSLERHQVRISLDDLKVESPYNTYVIKGLPIGPIANAGETSIQAVLDPAKTDAYYFYARPNGEVIFTSTLKEHNQVKNKYKSEWAQYSN